MNLEIKTKKIENINGIFISLSEAILPKGRLRIDPKGKICIWDLKKDKLSEVMEIISDQTEILVLDLNKEKEFKVLNSEKALKERKARIAAGFNEQEDSWLNKIKKAIFEMKVFTLTELREKFPEANFTTIRSYVHDLKNDELIVEIERGKYALR